MIVGVVFGSYLSWIRRVKNNTKQNKNKNKKKKEEKKKKKGKDKKRRILVQKKNQKSKEAKLPILFWPFVGSLFWSLSVQLLTQTHLLAFVVLFKTQANIQPTIDYHFGP
jgi:Na+/glutamate symporter